jgi:VIT1/CCC1 family predicted Fe2+/Mn2+ transporter
VSLSDGLHVTTTVVEHDFADTHDKSNEDAMPSNQQLRHIWFVGFILLLLASIALPYTKLRAAASVILSLSPSTVTMAPGGTVTMTIQVQAGTQSVDGAAAFLDFDPTRFEVMGVSPGTALSFPLTNQFDNKAGTLDQVYGALTAPYPSGTFTLATFQLRALAGTGDSTLTFNRGTPSLLRQSDVTSGGASVLGSVSPLTVHVVASNTLTTTPAATAITSATPTASTNSTPTATSVTLSLSPSTVTMTPGGTVTMTIEVQAGTKSVDGAAAFLDFDPTRFEVTGVSPGTALSFPLTNQFDNKAGTLDQVYGALTAPYPSGTFTLVTFQLRALAGTGDSTLTFNRGTPSLLRQSDVTSGGASILGSVSPLTVHVVASNTLTTTPVATVITSATPTATATASANSTPTATSVTLSLSPSTVIVAPGETVTMTIEVQAGTQSVDGAAAFLDFDPTRFEVLGVSSGTALSLKLTNQFDNKAGTLDQVYGTLTAPYPSGTFTLVTFQLRALAGTGDSTLTFNRGTPSLLRQSDVTSGGASILGSVSPLTVHVVTSNTITATPTLTSTRVPSPTPTTTQFKVFLPSVRRS